MGEVAEEGEGFALRGDHEHGVAHSMSGRGHRLDAGQEFLAVLVEDQAVAHRQQVLAGVHHEILQRAIGFRLIGPVVEIALGDIKLRVREQHLAAVVDHAADVIDMGVREHHGVDVLRLDAGFRHALLLAPGGRAEPFRRAHAGIEQHELVAGVHDRRILLEHDIVGRQEIVGEHLPHFFIRHAGESALGIAERQRPVGNHGDFGSPQIEAVEIGRLRPDLGRARQRAAAHQGGCAQTRTQGEQGPSRNMICHA